MNDAFDNPLALDGFEFVEFASPEAGVLEHVFAMLGFAEVAVHRSKDVALYRHGGINFIINREPGSLAAYFAEEHGAAACGLAAWRQRRDLSRGGAERGLGGLGYDGRRARTPAPRSRPRQDFWFGRRARTPARIGEISASKSGLEIGALNRAC